MGYVSYRAHSEFTLCYGFYPERFGVKEHTLKLSFHGVIQVIEDVGKGSRPNPATLIGLYIVCGYFLGITADRSSSSKTT